MNRRWVIVRKALLTKGLSFKDLAAITGYARGTVYNVVGGFSRSAKAREKIERALDLEPGTLGTKPRPGGSSSPQQKTETEVVTE